MLDYSQRYSRPLDMLENLPRKRRMPERDGGVRCKERRIDRMEVIQYDDAGGILRRLFQSVPVPQADVGVGLVF